MKVNSILKLALSLCLLNICFSSCGKLETSSDNDVENISNDQKLTSGNFKSSAHPTSGEAFIYEVGGVQKLAFKDFKTDSGPDLRVYLAEDTKAKNYVEVAGSVKNGTYSIDLPANTDFNTKKHVLIWCKAFSVLFGSAELK